jgi:hypothetical protein
MTAGDACVDQYGVDTTTTNFNTVVGEKKFLVQQLWQRGGAGCVSSRKSDL